MSGGVAGRRSRGGAGPTPDGSWEPSRAAVMTAAVAAIGRSLDRPLDPDGRAALGWPGDGG